MQVAKWGNSLAVRLPAALVRALKLKDGDDIDLVDASVLNEGVTLAVQPRRSRRDLVEDLRKFEGRLPKGFRFDREEANRR